MKMTKYLLENYIKAGGARIPSDMVIKNGKLVNVLTREIYTTDVAIYEGKVVGLGDDLDEYIGENTEILDAEGYHLVPGLIDGHLHIECSKLSMTSFAKGVVPFGTTSIISGLDEYISTIGIEGLK